MVGRHDFIENSKKLIFDVYELYKQKLKDCAQKFIATIKRSFHQYFKQNFSCQTLTDERKAY